MADNWGREIGSIKLSDATELHVNVDAELHGKKFLVLSKHVKTESYSGPAKNGTTLIPVEEQARFFELIGKAIGRS